MNLAERIVLPWYTEGPVVDGEGAIYFTTLSGGSIMRLDVIGGEVTQWAQGNKPNGQLILQDGDHLVCDSGNASVNRYDAAGNWKKHEIIGECAGCKIHMPNDLACDASGGVYFTDSIRETGKVCYYGPDGSQRIITDKLDFPNGIALSPDGKGLLIAESYRNRILWMPIASSGLPEGGWEVFAELPKNRDPEGYNLPDGIKFHSDGTLWVAHYGMQAVQVLDGNGKLLKTLAMDFPLPSNLCLTDRHLIVTGGSAEPGPGGIRIIRLTGN
ncbi:SMP-30/gluconolactonase/LRE family protein [Parapedobacter defluvii]|uniref:SMP-30/gluconolactonase/LRE family protein n=1 Tax=Parapedobacter defluvii TaxID=2045106 RepID=UPI00334104EB